LKSILEKLNETRTVVSEKVHLGEIIVTSASIAWRAIRSVSPDRLPFADCVDISAATPTSAFQGRNHGD
jgi:hypothetical protein